MSEQSTKTESPETLPNPDARPESQKESNRWIELITRIVAALACTLFLIFLENKFENSTTGELVEDTVHAWIQTFTPASNAPPKVQIVDISDLMTSTEGSMVTDPNSHQQLPVTSRKQLLELIQNIAKSEPLAIGVDIDFSNSDPNLPMSADDEEFFKSVKALNVPVTLGVIRSTWASAAKPLAFTDAPAVGWLGLQNEWAGLVAEQYVAPDGTRMNSISQSLVATSGIKPPDPNFVVGQFSNWRLLENRTERTLNGGGKVWSRPVDFKWIPQFEQRCLNYVPSDPGGVSTARQLIKGHIVLLGDVRNASDWFISYGRNLVPGVFIHGSAVETELTGLKFRVSSMGNVIVDVFVALLGFALLHYLKRALRRRNKRLHEGKLSKRMSFLAAGIVLILAFITNASGIEWLSFDVVLICAFLHPKLDHLVMEAFESKFSSTLRLHRQRIADVVAEDIAEEEK